MTEAVKQRVDIEVYDAARLVASLSQHDFEPLDHEFLQHVRDEDKIFPMLSGSVRWLPVEELGRNTHLNICEIYCISEGEDAAEYARHYLALCFEHSYANYAYVIDMDTGEAQIESEIAIVGESLERYSAIRQRVLGGLVLAADQLF